MHVPKCTEIASIWSICLRRAVPSSPCHIQAIVLIPPPQPPPHPYYSPHSTPPHATLPPTFFPRFLCPHCSLSLPGDFTEEKSAVGPFPPCWLSPAGNMQQHRKTLGMWFCTNVSLHQEDLQVFVECCLSFSPAHSCWICPSPFSKYNRKRGKTKACPWTSCSLPFTKIFLRIKTFSQTDENLATSEPLPSPWPLEACWNYVLSAVSLKFIQFEILFNLEASRCQTQWPYLAFK